MHSFLYWNVPKAITGEIQQAKLMMIFTATLLAHKATRRPSTQRVRKPVLLTDINAIPKRRAEGQPLASQLDSRRSELSPRGLSAEGRGRREDKPKRRGWRLWDPGPGYGPATALPPRRADPRARRPPRGGAHAAVMRTSTRPLRPRATVIPQYPGGRQRLPTGRPPGLVPRSTPHIGRTELSTRLSAPMAGPARSCPTSGLGPARTLTLWSLEQVAIRRPWKSKDTSWMRSLWSAAMLRATNMAAAGSSRLREGGAAARGPQPTGTRGQGARSGASRVLLARPGLRGAPPPARHSLRGPAPARHTRGGPTPTLSHPARARPGPSYPRAPPPAIHTRRGHAPNLI